MRHYLIDKIKKDKHGLTEEELRLGRGVTDKDFYDRYGKKDKDDKRNN